MKKVLFLPLLSVLFLSAGAAALRAEGEAAPPSEDLSFEQLENFRTERKYTEIVEALQPEDLSSKAGELGQDVDRLYALRGGAYQRLKEGPPAEADFKRALAASPDDGRSALYWMALGENYQANMSDPAAALAAYQKTIDLCLARQDPTSFLPIAATIAAAGILSSESRYAEAQILLEPYDDLMERAAPTWQIALLKASAEVYKGQGNQDEANARLQKAQDLEGKPESNP